MYREKIEKLKSYIHEKENEIKITNNEYNFAKKQIEDNDNQLEEQIELIFATKKILKLFKIVEKIAGFFVCATIPLIIYFAITSSPVALGLGLLDIPVTAFSVITNKTRKNKSKIIERAEEIIDEMEKIENEMLDKFELKLDKLSKLKKSAEEKLSELENAQEQMSRISKKYNLKLTTKEDKELNK